jgi:hypothetical protein
MQCGVLLLKQQQQQQQQELVAIPTCAHQGW